MSDLVFTSLAIVAYLILNAVMFCFMRGTKESVK